MPTLHDTTETTKKIGFGVGILVAVVFFLIFSFRIGKAIKNYLVPPGPPPPTVEYGRLDKIDFPQNVNTSPLTYTVDTISGVLPSFPPQLNVYPISWDQPGLLDLNRARNIVGAVGFKNPEKKISDEVYQWTDDSPLNETLTMNTTTLNFTMSSTYSTYSPITDGTISTDENGAIDSAKSYLGSMNLLPADIDISKTTTNLYTLKNGILLPATSLSTTQIIRVDLFQKDINTIPMYYPHPPYSSINFLVAGKGDVVDAKYFHEAIGSKGSTYPIKTADEALAELKNGKGYVASFFGTSNNVKITDVTLGYYIAGSQQDYLMPIIVFHGDNDFYAYVSAVKNDWVK